MVCVRVSVLWCSEVRAVCECVSVCGLPESGVVWLVATHTKSGCAGGIGQLLS